MLFFRLFPIFITLICVPFSMSALAGTDTETHSKSAAVAQQQCPIPTFSPMIVDAPKITDDSINITSKYSSIEKDQVANFNGEIGRAHV